MPTTSENRLRYVREWSGVVCGLAGLVLAVLGFVRAGNASKQALANERAITQVKAQSLLNEAWDLMGGRPGTTLIYEFSGDPADLELARRKVDDALILEPDSAMAHRLSGISHESFGRFSDAIRSYDASLRLEPEAPSTLINRGIALTRMGRAFEALDSFRKAMVHEDKKVVSLINSAALMWNSGHTKEAEQLFVQARKVLDSPQPGLLSADVNRLRSLLDRHDYATLANPNAAGITPPESVRTYRVELIRGLKRAQEVIR